MFGLLIIFLRLTAELYKMYMYEDSVSNLPVYCTLPGQIKFTREIVFNFSEAIYLVYNTYFRTKTGFNLGLASSSESVYSSYSDDYDKITTCMYVCNNLYNIQVSRPFLGQSTEFIEIAWSF